MRFRFAAVLTILFALVLSGCMQVRMDSTLKQDGSGTMSMSVGFSPSVAEAMKELKEMGDVPGMSNDMPDFSDLDRAKFEEACKKNGVKIVKLQEMSDDGSQKMEVDLEFQTLDGLNAALQSGMDGMGGMKLFKNADGNYVLKAVEPTPSDEEAAEAEAPAEETDETPSEPDPTQAAKAMEIMGKMMGAMSELEVSMRITVPGDIVASSAPTTEGRTAIWQINAENMMSAENMGEPEITFSSKGLDLKADPLPEE